MSFDARFSYFGLVEKLARAARLFEPACSPPLMRAAAVVEAGEEQAASSRA